MKKRISTSLVLVVALLVLASGSHADEPTWKLVWEDDFNGHQLDYSKWEIEVNAFGGGNNELQIYTDRKENVRVENGCLVIEARRDKAGVAGTVREFSSGRIRSKRRGDWKYGRFEVRAKLPAGQGLWPAIWMLPSDEPFGTWAASGEIDVMEAKGQEPKVLWGTLHYGSPWPNNKHSGSVKRFADIDLTQDFHTYGIEWKEGEVKWLFDGDVWQVQNQWSTDIAPFPAPFNHPFHMVLNLAVGGNFVGDPAPHTTFPSQFIIDWVRVHQRP